MHDADWEVTVAYNGEPYNSPGLRTALEAKGHRFRSTSDTEVLLRGFIEWGDNDGVLVAGSAAVPLWRCSRTSTGASTASPSLTSLTLLWIPHPRTNWTEIHKLPPAHALEALSMHFDDPFADPAAITLHRLCQTSDNNVLISGVGGEELWAGYPRHE